MKRVILAVLAVVLSAGMSLAASLELTPANPQPKGLKKGLKVTYSFGARPRSLNQAKAEFSGQPGRPIRGLNYPDKGQGAEVLTSGVHQRISAKISGYIKFDAAGEYGLEFYANDGLRIEIGGQRVGRLDGVNPCSSAGRPKVSVPKAGWYEVSAFYYQKEGTACLEAEWTKGGGGPKLIPDSAFGH